MRETYDKWLKVMTDEIDCLKIRAVAKKIIYYNIACAGFSFNFSIPMAVWFCLTFKENSTILSTLIILSSASVYASLVFTAAPIAEITCIFAKMNFFRVYFYLLPKCFLWCVKKLLCAMIHFIVLE